MFRSLFLTIISNLCINNNGYPKEFLFSIINDRLKSCFFLNNFDNIKDRNSVNVDPSNKERYFVVPYMNNISKKFKSITKKY